VSAERKRLADQTDGRSRVTGCASRPCGNTSLITKRSRRSQPPLNRVAAKIVDDRISRLRRLRMAGHNLFRRLLVLCVLSGGMSDCAAAYAQNLSRSRSSHHLVPTRAVAPPSTSVVLATRSGPVRNLTINRRPTGSGADDESLIDGPIRYDSIRTFDPAPYADSGTQFPLGLDGIGGYGSDIGVSAGHDARIYDRGP
jgi:hypothetical protein